MSLYLSYIFYFDKQKIETLINLLDNPKIHILLRFNIARTLIILKVKNKRFLSILKILIKDKNIKFNDVRELFQFLSAYNNLDKEYRKVLDIVRSKSPKYIRVKSSFMKISKYKEALAKGIQY